MPSSSTSINKIIHLVIIWNLLVAASLQEEIEPVATNLSTNSIIITTLPPDSSNQSAVLVPAIIDEQLAVIVEPTIVPPEPDPEDTKIEFTGNCFYSEPELCHPTADSSDATTTTTTCDCQVHPTYKRALYCCNVTNIDQAVSCHNLTNFEFIHVQNATLGELSFADNRWKLFQSIAITDGNITKMSHNFSEAAVARCLNVSSNELVEININLLGNLHHIEVLIMSNNNLSTIPNTNLTSRDLVFDFRGNNQIPCKAVMESMSRPGIKYIDMDNTFCLMNQTFSWFNSSNYVPLTSLMRMKQLQDECPTFEGNRSCLCKTDRFNYENLKEKQVIFTARVDCSNLGLTKLPDRLPVDTVFLNVSNNFITNLTEFSGNPSYQSVLKLYADENKITTILDLEGSHLIQNFDELSIRRNKLRTIPIYLFSNTLDRNPRKATISMDGNPFFCDCNTAKNLKIWLLARQIHIKDFQTIRCETGERVVELQETKICHSPHVWTDYIYWIIAAEIFLLVALICKVSYDYFVFKTSGYLPWPASAIPKIPFCDWLCET